MLKILLSAKYHIYCAWLNSCSKKNSTYLLELNKPKIDKLIEKWEKDWEINDADVRHLRRSYQLALHRFANFFLCKLFVFWA